MTPAAENQKSNTRVPQIKYPNRVRRVERALRSYLGRKITIVRVPYFRINTNIEASDTDERGMALFQYDPDADGQGKRQWRLFYENRVFQGDVS